MKRVHLTISGRVQTVGFRFSTKRLANKLGLTGWVKNNDDGTVEAVAEGEDEKLNQLLEFCKKGPFFAKVRDVKIEWQEFKREFEGFEIIY